MSQSIQHPLLAAAGPALVSLSILVSVVSRLSNLVYLDVVASTWMSSL